MGTRHYGERAVETSNAEKVLFPHAGLTKGDLVDYYERAADRILPHLENRPLVVQRFPDGIDEDGFYQKQVGNHFPDWIATVRVELVTADRVQELVVCNGKATLAYLVDQGCITFHPWLSRVDRVEDPDSLVIDLDPPGKNFETVRRAALQVRDLLERELELACFPKLTGSKGVHVVVPLRRGDDFDAVRAFAREAMELLVRRHPDELTTEQRKEKRGERIYLDTGRNAYGQTAVAPWSVRPLAQAPLAAPLAWNQLQRGAIGAQELTVENVLRKGSGGEDAWSGLRRRAHSLGPARARLDRLRRDEDC